jgi:predicted nucleic acid-binding protein
MPPPSPRSYYLDTSALVKLYVREPGSRRMVAWVGDRRMSFLPDVQIYVSRLVFPETMSAITRRRNDRRAPRAVGGLWSAVASDFLDSAPPYAIIDPTETIVGHAAFLMATHGLRGYDAVHLATALAVKARLSDPLIFVSADGTLNEAATAERLVTADPTV